MQKYFLVIAAGLFQVSLASAEGPGCYTQFGDYDAQFSFLNNTTEPAYATFTYDPDLESYDAEMIDGSYNVQLHYSQSSKDLVMKLKNEATGALQVFRGEIQAYAPAMLIDVCSGANCKSFQVVCGTN